MGAGIEIRNINRIFGSGRNAVQVLYDISADVPASSLTILRGRSGSGKTTLLNIVGALDEPTSGEILVDGQSLSGMSERARENLRRKRFGFVFQSVSLIPSMTAYQNVEFALRMAGIKGDHKARTEQVLQMVGLGSRMKHMPAELSGGEQQRVAIARAIVHHPEVVLADEPTAELDSAMAAEVTRLLKDLTRSEDVTVIMTTHDVGLMDAGDKVIELAGGRVV